jgi:hypothetical protein
MSSKFPRHERDLSDLREACKRYILPGYLPERPPFKKTDRVWTMGSCFADNVREALEVQGVPCAAVSLKERNNSPPLLRQFTEGLIDETGEARDYVSGASLAIITLGMAAAQFNEDGSFVFSDTLDIGTWKPLSAARCQDDISATIKNLRVVNPKLLVALTVSPVPLNRSPWRPGAVTADCISKTTLRVAVEQYLQTRPHGVTYWPAFEIARWLGTHRPGHFGADDGVLRHVSKDVVAVATELFVESFFEA